MEFRETLSAMDEVRLVFQVTAEIAGYQELGPFGFVYVRSRVCTGSSHRMHSTTTCGSSIASIATSFTQEGIRTRAEKIRNMFLING
ncbi:MAG: hypothetical protein MJY89_03095 [Bacteroidales bacterium]|nr:hypothetical protein [Bacteroidales bacterium]